MDVSSENPFEGLKIDSHDPLHRATARARCPECSSSRKYFCYQCYIPMEAIAGKIPTVKLPLKVDIVKHPLEVDGKSTAVHARILAPDHVTIYTYPNIPQYDNKDKLLLIFPCKEAVSLEQLMKEHTASSEEHSGSSQDKPQPHLTTQKSNTHLRSCGQSSLLEPKDKRNTFLGSHEQSSSLEPNLKCNTYQGSSGQSSPLEPKDNSNTHLESSGHSSPLEPKRTETAWASSQTEASHEMLDASCSSCQQVEGSQTWSTIPSDHSADGTNCSPEGDQTPVGPGKGLVHHLRASDQDGASHRCHHICHAEANERDGAHCVKHGATIGAESKTGRFEKVIFIDCTWNQTGVLKRDERLAGIQRVILEDRLTTFWRKQYKKPQTYLATIEAIYYFMVDFHTIVLKEVYTDQYDNLLYFYSFMYHLVQETAKQRAMEKR